ncbi:DUF2946 family protein [Halomonas sp. DP1Y21-3]|uniref:DUF2946 family protein n=1 Tax=Halomonas sp. DP1Y21-3 TaxID=2859080 RepID=UPI001C945184|nr:DUF2946 family protein [Halomonas sp. DP1Y21-3]MBY6109505.1 DUF2946 family protein [Halomonas sp. DP1Y21-3]
MPSAARLLSSRPRRQRRVCLLAVLAMLMLFVGPLISQVQRLAMEDEAGRQHHHGHGHHQGLAQGTGQGHAQHDPTPSAAEVEGHGTFEPSAEGAVGKVEGHGTFKPAAEGAVGKVEGHGTSEPAAEGAVGDAGHHHLAACGYCVLFAQVPWLALLLLVLVSLAPRAPPARCAAGIPPVVSGRFQRPTPRAPPASLS